MKRMMAVCGLAMVVMGGSKAWGSEPARGCYRSVTEAVAGQGTQDGDGYWVESLRLDVLLGRSWATVGRCGHPEWPAMVVASGNARVAVGTPSGSPSAAVSVALAVRAGAAVTVVRNEEAVRMEMAGVAQQSGGVGERIRVRVVRVSDEAGAPEEFVEAVVKSADVLEMEP